MTGRGAILFATSRRQPPDQWRAALEKFRPLRDRELIDWLILQIDVATNLANGVQDMRPRDPGPTWLVTLEYVSNRKRKALATLHWAEAAEKEGCFTVDSEWHARSAAILGRELVDFERGDGGHEGVPFIVERDKYRRQKARNRVIPPAEFSAGL